MDYNSKNEVDYEEQQLQIILMKAIQRQSLLAERELKKQQDQEFFDALNIDAKMAEPQFKKISLEEMRKIRLKRFGSTE